MPDEVRDELAAHAARSGRSLQEYLLRELEDLASKPVEEVVARVRTSARATGSRLDARQILAARDADRR